MKTGLKKTMWILINFALAMVIIAIIVATWMPAIYSSDWFKHTFPKL